MIRSLLKKKFCTIQIKQKLIIFEKLHSFWKNENEILWHENCLYVSSNLKKNVIKSNYDNFFANHFDVTRILKLIRQKYYWSNEKKKKIQYNSNMRTQTKKYYETYAICKKNKTFRHKLYKKLSFFLYRNSNELTLLWISWQIYLKTKHETKQRIIQYSLS